MRWPCLKIAIRDEKQFINFLIDNNVFTSAAFYDNAEVINLFIKHLNKFCETRKDFILSLSNREMLCNAASSGSSKVLSLLIDTLNKEYAAINDMQGFMDFLMFDDNFALKSAVHNRHIEAARLLLEALYTADQDTGHFINILIEGANSPFELARRSTEDILRLFTEKLYQSYNAIDNSQGFIDLMTRALRLQ